MAAVGGPHVVLVRHGETEWSALGRHTGRTDIELTPTGRRHAELLGRRLSSERFSLVLTSPLVRAAETCALAGLGDQAEVDADLVEWDYGAYEGRTTADIRTEAPGWTIWDDGVPGGEGAGAIAARCERVLARARSAAGPVALFGHGHALRALAARWLGQPVAHGRHLALGTAALCVLGIERECPVLQVWNEQCHLEGPGA